MGNIKNEPWDSQGTAGCPINPQDMSHMGLELGKKKTPQ
jgi:hypothetical protein